MNKVPLTQIATSFSDTNYIMIIGLGFDERCLSTLKHFPLEKTEHIIGIANAGWNDFNKNSIDGFKQLVGSRGVVLGDNAKDVLAIADNVIGHLRPILNRTKSIVIDVTAMSHELLVVLLGMMQSLKFLDNVTLLYVGAAKYSYNDGEIWLSRGVRDIRSILGFPGTMLPSKKLHLIVMAGFEVERASEAITRYEPASLSLGVGKKEHSVSEDHHNNNKIFYDRLKQFVMEQKTYSENTQQFEFSCIDPWQAKKDILAHIDGLAGKMDKNFVICPLNTKLSTVGIVLAAFERPELQICYVEPIEYNTACYAQPGEDVTIIKLQNT